MSVYRVGSNKSSVNNFPSVRPTLDLDFANSKTLDPRITFTRASGGSYVGADGLIKYAGVNEARFDHDPVTGESLGLLVEEARTNLLLQSNGFDTTWTNTNSSETAASGIAPDGTNTAWELRDTVDASSVIHALLQTIVFTSGTTYTLTTWMKSGTLTEGFLALPSSAFSSVLFARFNLLTGDVIQVASGVTASSQLFSNGWVRVRITSTATSTSSGSLQIRVTNGSNSYQGDGTGTILIWGAQLEAQAFLSSYIPTQGSTRTRARDSAVITGKNFSSWYRQDEGTVFAEYARFAPNLLGTSRRLFEITNGTVSNRISTVVGTGTNIANAFITKDGAGQLSPSFTQINMDSFGGKSAFTFKNNNFSYSYKTQPLLRSFVGSIPEVMIQANIGSAISPSTFTQANGCISRLTYYPKRLPNQQLRALTR
jgi:hypothetical protein